MYQFIQLINKLMDIFRSLIRSISIVIHEFFFFCGTLCISRSVRENASLNIKRREIFNNKKRNIYCFTQCLHSFQSSGDSTFRHYIRSVFVFDLVWFNLIWFFKLYSLLTAIKCFLMFCFFGRLHRPLSSQQLLQLLCQ